MKEDEASVRFILLHPLSVKHLDSLPEHDVDGDLQFSEPVEVRLEAGRDQSLALHQFGNPGIVSVALEG